jgi:hypothetical protein
VTQTKWPPTNPGRFNAMSDSVPDGDQQHQSLQTEMKERAELISVVLTTVLEEAGYASAVDHARKLFAHTTPAQMEQMKTSLQFTRSGVHDPRGLFQGLTGSSGPLRGSPFSRWN